MTRLSGPPRRPGWTAQTRVAVAILTVAILLTGCGATTVTAPPEGAAEVVPADALAYVNLSLDRSDSAVSEAEAALARLPGYTQLVRTETALLSTITGAPFEARIKPWLGTEIAVALLPAGQSANELIVLSARNRAKARRFVATVSGGASARFLRGFVVIGSADALAAVGSGRSLGSLRAFHRALAGAPAARVLEAYATGPGLAELLGNHTGLSAVGASVLATEDPTEVAAALSPTRSGLEVWVRLAGVPDVGGSFEPDLATHLPASTAWVAQMPSLVGSAPGLLSVLASASGFGSGASSVSELAQKLGPALEAEGLATAPLQALFNHASAIFDLDNSIGVMTRTADVKGARLELGNAGQALAELFAASNGGGDTAAPLVGTSQVHGVAVTTFQSGTNSQLDLAVFDGVAVITTSPAAMDAIIDQKRPLSSSAAYESALPDTGRSAGPVLFGAINRLVADGGQAALLESLGLGGATRMLARIDAAGLASTSDGNQTTAELYFTIS